MRLKMIGIILLIAVLLASPARVQAATVSDISKELICQCGCTMVLGNCTHAECGSREAMTAFITEKIDQGQSREQITQLLVAQYGEQVLAVPPKQGFNLTAWLLPFVALILGAGVIYITLKQWSRRGKSTQVVPAADAVDKRYYSRLEKELTEFTEKGFR